MDWDLAADEASSTPGLLLPERNGEQCLDQLIKAAPGRELVADQDIRDHRGTLLWAKGQGVNSDLRERLITRRLLAPLESSLAFRDSLRIAEVSVIARSLVEQHPALEGLLGVQQARVLDILGQARIVAGPGMLLTVMAENRPEALRHAVMVAMIAVWLALQLGRSEPMLRHAAEAGLMHDLGELYLAAEVIQPRGRLDFSHWRALCVHPLVGCALLRESKVYGETVAVAVREHHERVDGSGYPSGTATVSPLGQLLLSAEVLATLMSSGEYAIARADIALRMIPGQFPREVVETVVSRLRSLPPAASPVMDTAQLASAVIDVLQQLEQARQQLGLLEADDRSSAPQRELLTRLGDQLARYTAAIHESGAPEISANPDWLIDAPEVADEVGRILREMSWQLPGLHRHAELMVRGRVSELTPWQPLLEAMDIRVTVPSSHGVGAGTSPVVLPDAGTQIEPDQSRLSTATDAARATTAEDSPHRTAGLMPVQADPH